jgi:hypothetical protein
MVTEAQVEVKVARTLSTFNSGNIDYYPYISGETDRFKQRVITYGTAVPLVGRAILSPTEEEISGIGDARMYEVGFLFSRLEMVSKFPLGVEGEWLDGRGQLEWRGRRYKIDKVHPTGQVASKFLIVVVLCSSLKGSRDA